MDDLIARDVDPRPVRARQRRRHRDGERGHERPGEGRPRCRRVPDRRDDRGSQNVARAEGGARRGARSGGASHAAAETGATTEAANAFRAFRFGATAAAASGLTVNRVATRTYNVYWPFTGFTPRFGVRNQVQAGAGFPVTFALGANPGLAIFAAASRSRRCAAPATPAQSRRNRCTLRTGPTRTRGRHCPHGRAHAASWWSPSRTTPSTARPSIK